MKNNWGSSKYTSKTSTNLKAKIDDVIEKSNTQTILLTKFLTHLCEDIAENDNAEEIPENKKKSSINKI